MIDLKNKVSQCKKEHECSLRAIHAFEFTREKMITTPLKNLLKKRKIALHLATIITVLTAVLMTLAIDRLINVEKSIVVTSDEKLKSDSFNNYQFYIKRANKTNTVFITRNTKRFYFISCSSYIEKFCDDGIQISEQKFKIQEIDFIKLNNRRFVKKMVWIDPLNNTLQTHIWKNEQIIEFYQNEGKISKTSIFVFLLFTIGGILAILMGSIQEYINKRFQL